MNLHDMLKNFPMQDLQKQMQQMQESMKHITVTGSSGGGMVFIEMNGNMEITKLTIDPLVIEDHDVQMLQDLLRAAVNSVLSNWRDKVREETARFPIPGMFGQQS